LNSVVVFEIRMNSHRNLIVTGIREVLEDLGVTSRHATRITLATYQENMIFLLLKGCSESSETILKFIVLAFNKSKLFETLQIIVHT
jgi:hypothetical protein